MIDASAAVEYLMRTALGLRIAELIDGASLYAPEILDAEVLSVLRRGLLQGRTTEERTQAVIQDLLRWPVVRISHRRLALQAWQHRHNVSAYDAFYVAAAQNQGAPLLTADRRLSRAPSLGIDIVTV